MSTAPRVAVIGAGIVGASIAYHLARRGAAVTVLDRGQPAGRGDRKVVRLDQRHLGQPRTLLPPALPRHAESGAGSRTSSAARSASSGAAA